MDMKDMVNAHEKIMSEIDMAISQDRLLSKKQASYIIENIIDSLIEVGNGISDEELGKQVKYAIALRDLYFVAI